MRSILIIIVLLLSLNSSAQKDYRWKHMKGTALKFIQKNAVRTGVITKIYSESDGDLHVWLKVKDTVFVAEIICYIQTPICKGYTNKIARPKIGQRYRITGDLVYDSIHHWYELHPVKKIEIIKFKQS